MTTEVIRKEKEAEFHNQREIDRNSLSKEDFENKYPNKTFYCITNSVRKYEFNLIKKNCRDKVVLDYCCGLGNTSRKVAKYGPKKVIGIDISSSEIETCRLQAKNLGLDNVEHHVMDAEKMSLESNSVDIVICNGVLHHLDVNIAFKEIHRVLKKGGIMIAHEALGYNPIIQSYRRLTPKIRTEWETDHILSMKEVNLAKKYFTLHSIKFFYLFSILAIPFRKSKIFKPFLKFLSVLDSVILRLPFIRLMAWQMIFVMKK